MEFYYVNVVYSSQWTEILAFAWRNPSYIYYCFLFLLIILFYNSFYRLITCIAMQIKKLCYEQPEQFCFDEYITNLL